MVFKTRYKGMANQNASERHTLFSFAIVSKWSYETKRCEYAEERVKRWGTNISDNVNMPDKVV